jgi:hypothetical protein
LFNLLRSQGIFGIAESWAGLETYKVRGYTSYFKGRYKTAKYGRNPGDWPFILNMTLITDVSEEHVSPIFRLEE